MKKIIALILSLTLIVALSPAVYADSGSSEEALKVLSAIKPRIPDTSAYEEFDSSSYREGEKTVYTFNWNSSKDGIYRGMYVSALKNGIITSFGINEDKLTPDDKVGFNRISKEEARIKADTLVKALNPAIGDHLTLKADTSVESFDDNGFLFSIVHTESGIPVFGDSGRVRIDIKAEKITSFSLSYTEGLTYPSPIKIIDLATAKAAFTGEIGLDIFYRSYTDTKTKNLDIFPLYAPKSDDVYINALTGKAEKVVPYFDTYFSKNESASDTILGSGGANGGLTDAELKEIAVLRKLLSQKTAEEAVRKNKHFGLDEGFTLEEFSTRRLSVTEELYGHSLVFKCTGEDRVQYVYIDINAETGEVISFSNFGTKIDEAVAEPAEDLKAKAQLILNELSPQKASEYRLKDNDDENSRYFVFERMVNGIFVEGNTASIEFNPDNSLASYRIRYTNAEFPEIDSIKTKEEACDRFFDYTKYTLRYIPQKSAPELTKPDMAALIYAPETTDVYIDAYTLERVNYNGTAYTQPVPDEYTDISGHYAEEKISALRRFGIGFENSEFCPDAEILQKDFIILLAGAFGGMGRIMINETTANDEYYKTAKRLGIILEDEVAPESTVSRLQAAKFICRALNIEKYALLDNIFNCPFKDVESGKGYVTMLWGLEIINGTAKGVFSPQQNLTRAQSAIIIYNAMEKG